MNKMYVSIIRNKGILVAGFAVLLISLCSFHAKFPSPPPTENIYLHLDRSLYITGDRLWYKAYVVDAGHHRIEFSASKVLYLEMFNAERKRVTQQILMLEQGQSHGDIFLSDTLGSGVYILVAYTSSMTNTDASSLYRKEFMLFNRYVLPGDRPDSGSPKAGISGRHDSTRQPPPRRALARLLGNRTSYGTREKVSFDILISHDAGPALSAFSISAARVPPVEQIDDRTILDIFNNPASGTKPGVTGISDDQPNEHTGLLIGGELLWKNGGEPVADKRLWLAIPDSVPTFDYGRTDSLGRFCFVLDQHFSSSQLYLQFEDRKIKADSVMIRWQNHFRDSVMLPGEISALPGIDQEYLVLQQKRIAIGHAYGIDQKTVPEPDTDRAIHPYPFYGNPEEVIDPDEYLPLSNLKEITRELLTGTRFTGQPGRYSLDVFNPVTSKYMSQPFVLLDGVPVYDFDKVAGLGSANLDRIEIQQRVRVYGDLVFEGMVALYTNGKLINNMDLSASHLKYNFPKFKRSLIPQMPDYRTDENNRNIPDFRDLLYWGPVNQTGPDGQAHIEFYTSDETGLFRITVEGLTLDGVPFSATADFNVLEEK